MSDRITIRSRFREYQVSFARDCARSLELTAGSAFFIIDAELLKLYRAKLEPVLTEGKVIPVEAVEQNKNIDFCQKVILGLLEAGMRRNSMLVAIGGGIIQDICGFIASILFRGIEWTFYPTTLLAQADSCVGSKSSLNVGPYKNLLGSFYPPAQVIIDANFLLTLPVDEIKSGIGEILHFYLVDGSSKGKTLMDRYEELSHAPVLLEDHIRSSLEIKKKTVEMDELDHNERNLFNYGHTFGHAIESVSNYGVKHGQAVTLGMDIANYLSLQLGYLEYRTFLAMRDLLSKNMPAFGIESGELDRYFKALAKDKKNIDNNLTCILTAGPGAMRKVTLPFDSKLKEAIASYFLPKPVEMP